jgi:hypothetical protein
MLVFFTFIILIISLFSIGLVKYKTKGKGILIIYGFITFFLGFLPMTIEGGTLLSLGRISPQKLAEYCRMDPESPQH